MTLPNIELSSDFDWHLGFSWMYMINRGSVRDKIHLPVNTYNSWTCFHSVIWQIHIKYKICNTYCIVKDLNHNQKLTK